MGDFYIHSTTEAESLGTVSWLQRAKNINSHRPSFHPEKYEEEEEEEVGLCVLTWKDTPCVMEGDPGDLSDVSVLPTKVQMYG